MNQSHVVLAMALFAGMVGRVAAAEAPASGTAKRAEAAAPEDTAASVVPMQTIRPRRSDEVLFNPGMGLYLAGGGMGQTQLDKDAWVLQIADIVYFRLVWSDLEPDGPGSHFDAYFGPVFDFWVKTMGKRVAFRVMSESMHSRSQYATPKWVFDQGVPGVRHTGLYQNEQIDPVFWNDKYLMLYCEFVERLGKYLDGWAGLEFIDVGGIGEWGEMHLGLHISGRWTPEQLEQTGFTRDQYIAAYRRVIDAHAEAFPHTRVFLNVGNYAQINDYAALRGLHFRQDGLTPRGPSADVGNRFYRPYARRGVICNYEFHSGYASMFKKGWDLKQTLEVGLSDPISYLNTNVFGMRGWEKAPEEVKQLFLDAARRIGYRFVLDRLNVQKTIRLDTAHASRLMLQHEWINIGVAPCYDSYALEFTLHSADGRVVARQRHFPGRATTLWWPNETIAESTVLRIPSQTRPGQYELKVAMIKPEQPGQPIRLGMAQADAEGRYLLCRIPAVRFERTGADVSENFDGTKPGWHASEGISIALDCRVFHSGRSSLRVEGTQQDAWNYVNRTIPGTVYPGSKYRLSCWMKVETLEPHRTAPYLKLGVDDADAQWIANFHSTKYDTSRLGEWQHLTGIFETPSRAASGHFAVEKGDKDASVTIRFWLDDMQLELLEGP